MNEHTEINVTYHFTQRITCLPTLKFDCLHKNEETSRAAEYVGKLVSVLVQLQDFLVSSDLEFDIKPVLTRTSLYIDIKHTQAGRDIVSWVTMRTVV